jgi:putative transposase
MQRWERLADLRYLTFSCQGRLALLGRAEIRDLFVALLAAARERCGFLLVAWVVMPEHVHLIILPDVRRWPVAKVCVALKQPLAQRMIRRWRELRAPILERIRCDDGRVRFWQAGGGFDRNIRDGAELKREIEYIHQNPVKRGLVEKPTDWAWSSARWYAGIREGQVPIDEIGRY